MTETMNSSLLKPFSLVFCHSNEEGTKGAPSSKFLRFMFLPAMGPAAGSYCGASELKREVKEQESLSSGPSIIDVDVGSFNLG